MRVYQNIIGDFFTETPYAAGWVDMGLGKTISTLTALKTLFDEFEISYVLVVAPLRVARKVWSDEIDTWGHTRDLRVSHIIGTPSQRFAALEYDADIYTINNENIKWLVDHHIHERKMVKKWRWDTLVIDESSCYKSHSANRFKALKKVRPLLNRVIELTGTPGNLEDLWAQIYLLDKGERLGKNITAFRNRWFLPPGKNRFKWTPMDHAEKEIMEAIEDIVITLRAEDWLELPEVVYNPIRVTLSKKEHAKYKTMAKESVMELGGEEIVAVNAGVLSGKLLQLANGAAYTTSPAWEAFHDHKVSALMETLQTIEGPTLVCYNFKSDLVRIKKALTAAKANWAVLTDGESEDKFNRGETDVLLLHPKSAGHGLNLQHGGASNLIWFGLTWSLELFLQANARIIGGLRRKQAAVIHMIITENTIDELVVKTIDDKNSGQDRRMDMLKQLVDDVTG